MTAEHSLPGASARESIGTAQPAHSIPIIFFLCCLFALSLAPTRSQAAESAGHSASESSGVRRTVYPNGLVLLSKEVHAAPVVSVWVYYKVGSRNEVQGIFGISHQIEHMMFKGTENLRPGDIDRLFSERGGVNNAETTEDYTAYNETLPSSALEVALRVESDRMEHAAMNAGELDHEKKVVLSELEGDENSPLYKLDTAVTEAAFTAHPYHHPVIGYAEDVRNFSRGDVLHYYQTHYAPNNAILVVVGDFQTAALQRAVAYYFNKVPARTVADHLITPEQPQNGERRVQTVGIGDTSYVEIAYHVPKTGARDHYVMDLISGMLAGVVGSGRSSRLYRALVQKGLATEVGAGDPDQLDPQLMVVTATVAHGHTQQEVETAIEAEIERLKTEMASQPELEKTYNQVKASFVYRDDSVTSQASELGLYAALNNYQYEQTYLAQIRTVTPAEIQAAAQRYFTTENRTVGWFLPRPPKPGEALPSTGRAGAVHYKPTRMLQPGKPWADVSPAARAFDLRRLFDRRRRRRRAASPRTRKNSATAARGIVPELPDPSELAPSSQGQHPPVTRQVLPNGMVVIVYPNHSNPDVAISGSIRVGSMADPPGKAGVANFVATMLNRGTANRTEDQIASQLDNVGASVDLEARGSGTFFSGRCLDENVPLCLEILADELRNATFPEGTFPRVKNEIGTLIQAGNEDPGTVATQKLFATLYPESYPVHWPVVGTPETLARIGRRDLIDYYSHYYRPDLTTIVLVGDIDPAVALSEVERLFGTWKAEGPTPSTEPAPSSTIPSPGQVVTTMPDKSEAVVTMGFPGIARKDPDYYAADLMNMILGSGDFNSRLMKDVRDKKGLVYYIGSQWVAGVVPGPWILQMETNPSDVDSAVQSTTADIKKMMDQGPTPDEIRLFKGLVSGSQALRLETSAGIADLLSQAEFYGLGQDYLWQYPELIRAVTPAQLKSAGRKLLHPEQMVTSVAGPYPKH